MPFNVPLSFPTTYSPPHISKTSLKPNQWRDDRDLCRKYASFEINVIPKALKFLVWDKTQRLQYFLWGASRVNIQGLSCVLFLWSKGLDSRRQRWSSKVISRPQKETFVSYYTVKVFMLWWTTVSPVKTQSCFLCHLYGCTYAASFRDHCSYIVAVKLNSTMWFFILFFRFCNINIA